MLSTELVTPNIEVEEEGEGYARLVAEPVEAGFGVTLGNALRRVLLSSLPGAAVTSVRIEEVQHEFSTIPHMKEDTTEFLLNVKEIRLRALSDRPAKLYLEGLGEGRVLAGDIQMTADYEIVNPELHLATLDSADARLTVEFNVETGRGCVPAGRQTDGMPIGVIPVDAIFSPVRRVNFAVERTRVGQVTNYDRLALEVWTDGTVTGVEAVSQAADILLGQFALFGIRLRALSDRPAKLYLEGRGEGRVLAGDIQVTADYEIVNPELHLATLDSAEAHLTYVEFNVERGRGWVPAGRQTDGTPIGVIPVDAIFTPVRRVNFAVERTRVGQVTHYDRLVLEVWTDGTVTGVEAVSQAADILLGSSLSSASSASLRPRSWREAWARALPWNRTATTRRSKSSTYRYVPTTASSAAGS